jgi:hypothetical protein
METSAVNDGGLTDDGEQVPSHGQFGGHEGMSLYDVLKLSPANLFKIRPQNLSIPRVTSAILVLRQINLTKESI